MTVRELLARIDSREFSEWIAFFSLGATAPAAPVARTQSDEEIAALLAQRQRLMPKGRKG